MPHTHMKRPTGVSMAVVLHHYGCGPHRIFLCDSSLLSFVDTHHHLFDIVFRFSANLKWDIGETTHIRKVKLAPPEWATTSKPCRCNTNVNSISFLLFLSESGQCCYWVTNDPLWSPPLAFNISRFMTLQTEGCMNSSLCNKTKTGSLLTAGYTVTRTCCSTDRCNGATSIQLPLTAAVSAALLAVWSTWSL